MKPISLTTIVVLFLLLCSIVPAQISSDDASMHTTRDDLEVRILDDEIKFWFISQPQPVQTVEYISADYVTKYFVTGEIWNPNSFNLSNPEISYWYIILETNNSSSELGFALHETINFRQFNFTIPPGLSTFHNHVELDDTDKLEDGKYEVKVIAPAREPEVPIVNPHNTRITMKNGSLTSLDIKLNDTSWGDISNSNRSNIQPISVRLKTMKLRQYAIRTISQYGVSFTAEIWNPTNSTIKHVYPSQRQHALAIIGGHTGIDEPILYKNMFLGSVLPSDSYFSYEPGLNYMSGSLYGYIANNPKAEFPTGSLNLTYGFPPSKFDEFSDTVVHDVMIKIEDNKMENKSTIPSYWPESDYDPEYEELTPREGFHTKNTRVTSPSSTKNERSTNSLSYFALGPLVITFIVMRKRRDR